jgi:hypothetical protein
MLPPSAQIPGGVLLLVVGVLACFAGYRLFRIVLALYGFVLGALVATSVLAPSDTIVLAIAALVGGAVGAAILTVGYFVGVALVGAGVGAMTARLVWDQLGGEPHAAAVILLAVLGAVAAVWFQRIVIIIGTAFGGAWTAMAGAVALLGPRAPRSARAIATLGSGEVWIPYAVPPGQRWVLLVWLVLGLAGVAVQFGLTAGREKKV